MKRLIIYLTLVCMSAGKSGSQVLINELYTDPGAGKHEFFELYNSTAGNSSISVNNFTMITFFEISGQKGFYVMDLPNLNVASKGYFVGSSALPFNYQGVTNTSNSDFNWNSAAFTGNQGYLRKWVQASANLLDGNLFYDQAALPADFNDFFYRRTGSGASYTVFLYKDGELINSFAGGAGGQSTIINDIVNMPNLFIDMSGSSPDFTLNFSGYASIPVESTTQDAGSDNGFIREMDGGCYSWDKSSAQVQHTPRATNGGGVTNSTGNISVSSALVRGNTILGSTVNYDVVAAPASVFPVTLEIYLDNGSVQGSLDAADSFVTSEKESAVSEGPFSTIFFPFDASILIVVRSNAGCIDKIQYLPNAIPLAVTLVSFDGEKNNNRVDLNWTIDKNELIRSFEIEKSHGNGRFQWIGSVNAVAGRGHSDYSFTDGALQPGINSYRLRIIGQNNEQSYSRQIAVSVKHQPSLFITNNPVKNMLGLSYSSMLAGDCRVALYDLAGRKRLDQSLKVREGLNKIQLDLTNLNGGVYLLEMLGNTGRQVLKFMKN